MKCPICMQESFPEYRPFCSKLCKDKDLLSWFNEDYRVVVDESTVENEGDENA